MLQEGDSSQEKELSQKGHELWHWITCVREREHVMRQAVQLAMMKTEE